MDEKTLYLYHLKARSSGIPYQIVKADKQFGIMIRAFTIFINYNKKLDGNYLEAKVVEYRHSPSSFYITFYAQDHVSVPSQIILNTKDGKLILAKESPQIDDKILKPVIEEINRYLRLHKV
jgi:hypothetical protein